MDERIIELFYDRFIEFSFGTFRFKLYVLAELACKIMHQSSKAGEYAADWKHAHVHGIIAQCKDKPFAQLTQRGKLLVLSFSRHLCKTGVECHHFTNKVYELVKLFRIDAYSLLRSIYTASSALRNRRTVLLHFSHFLEVALFSKRRPHFVLGDNLAFHKHFAKTLLLVDNCIELFAGNLLAVNEYFADFTLCVWRDVYFFNGDFRICI